MSTSYKNHNHPRCMVISVANEFLHVVSWKKGLRLVDATYIPEYLWEDQDFLALPKHLQRNRRRKKVDVLAWYDEEASSESCSFRIPAVVRLTYNVETKKTERLNAPTLRNILVRDEWKCQYCGCALTQRTGTRDHVVPTANGGPNRIENLVASCKPCNNAKDNMSLSKFEKLMGVELNKDQLRKLTEEEKVKAAIKGFKKKEERNVWFKTLKENDIELW